MCSDLSGHQGQPAPSETAEEDHNISEPIRSGSQQHRSLPVSRNGLAGQHLTKVPQLQNHFDKNQSFGSYLQANDLGFGPHRNYLKAGTVVRLGGTSWQPRGEAAYLPQTKGPRNHGGKPVEL